MKHTIEAMRNGIVAVIRESDADAALAAGIRAHEGGACAVEVTWTTPDAQDVLRELARRGARIGAGTIMTPAQAAQAVDAGAEFLVAPVNPTFLIPFALGAGVVPIPAGATPTEIHDAAQAGAPVVKVFPATRLGGAAFIRDLLAPMPELRLMCTGGITQETADGYLDAGAHCVGLSFRTPA